jgi:L-lactate dehydrogenase complex protein LldG
MRVSMLRRNRVFVAGPSKTADIEQSLVIGAHGPKSLTVLLIDPS